ncbi:MAG: hypothetical protein MI746_04035, partial [Pseudomonadales bacterium]|nr:hypothetical protein [Pseudomonadales bacterium]
MTSPNLTVCVVILTTLLSPAFTQDTVVWHGGISEEERALAPDSGTRLVFFVRAGNFLSDIAVNITNSAG